MAGQRRKLLDAHRLGECELVQLVQPHGPQRNPHHRRRSLEQLQVGRRETHAVVALGGDTCHHALALDHRHPEDMAWPRRAIAVDRDRRGSLGGRHRLGSGRSVIGEPAEEGGLLDRRRTERNRRPAAVPVEADDVAGRIQVGKDHVRGVCVIADRGKHGFGDLALI